MKKILRVVGCNQYVERLEFYMDEMEKVVCTTDPLEALDCSDILAPEYEGGEITAAVSWMRSELDTLLEVVTVL